MKERFSRNRVLRENPKVNRQLVQRFEALEESLRLIGVEVRPKYRLSPPLGGAMRPVLHDLKGVRRGVKWGSRPK